MSAESYQYALSVGKLSFEAYNLPRHLKFNSMSLVFDYLFWMPLTSVEPRYAECFDDLPEVKFLNIVLGACFASPPGAGLLAERGLSIVEGRKHF